MTEYSGLQEFIERHRRLFTLTGAGCSTRSGIPDYRDTDGQWKRARPVTYQAFMGEEKTRRRYWARSLIGWRLIRQANQTTRIALWRGSRPEAEASSCSPRTWTGCTRRLAACR